ncbi:NADH:flavin oxidoreductase/NADH oxidase family protein [Inhella gelatinilytica]|uniref:NADH:flavin oxidoreductase/NADH oxidase family protein n=1 Tax=Inhella gelatinilytica TaxID=2795030 RepID=A0A931IUW1_9BURK|nr:NADH:flavin oxidoreductase/NADH oxidase family protein [Inhella gelatinilytica]MBH9551429.1 NADH:flavin oxidoreductase/NADH oxidase family protein [Inhella gelatinilytica]
MPAVDLFSPLILPNGQTLKNRLVKAAMEESLAQDGQLPGQGMHRLYRTWAEGGVGLQITGNVMVAADAMTTPGGVVLQAGTPLAPFKAWADAAHSQGARVWMQISHPGRQVMAALGNPGWAPSEVPLKLGQHSKLFAQPKALDVAQIQVIVQQFAQTAAQAEAAGFDGVQIHAAHGYLISQFLSPLANQRSDAYGGAIENRARLLLEVVRAVRAAVRPGFAVGVKLNSADFQRGGFSEADAQAVVGLLNAESIDLLELSGGSYESPAMQGRTADGRTLAREAYFLEFAKDLAAVAQMPVMTTGGVRRREVAQQVVDSGIAAVGLATALAMDPQLPARWARGDLTVPPLPIVPWRNKALVSLTTMAMVRRQMHRLAAGWRPKARLSPWFTLVCDRWQGKRQAQRYRGWRATDAAEAPRL